jgi:Fic family protein
METASFSELSPGRLIAIADGAAAFAPAPLPPTFEPMLETVNVLAEAERELGRLAGAAGRLLNPHLVAGPLLRREAIVSSRIEGTVATPHDVLVLEAADAVVPPLASGLEPTREVLNYVHALEHGIARLADLPLCVRLFCELHEVLLRDVRGDRERPGELRTIQNWIGKPGSSIREARFVPPPPAEMRTALEELEKYLNEEPSPSSLPLLIKAALAHYQFEAIHPFRDGNGRVGRLLITLSLVAWGLIGDPLLYMSSYFERRRGEYMDRMLAVSTAGDWDGWIRFFLAGIAESARDGLRQTERLLQLRERYQAQVQAARSSALLPKLVDHLFRRPSVTIADVARVLDVTFASASASVRKLVEAGVLEEATGRKRDQVFVAPEIMRFIGEA